MKLAFKYKVVDSRWRKAFGVFGGALFIVVTLGVLAALFGGPPLWPALLLQLTPFAFLFWAVDCFGSFRRRVRALFASYVILIALGYVIVVFSIIFGGKGDVEIPLIMLGFLCFYLVFINSLAPDKIPSTEDTENE